MVHGNVINISCSRLFIYINTNFVLSVYCTRGSSALVLYCLLIVCCVQYFSDQWDTQYRKYPLPVNPFLSRALQHADIMFEQQTYPDEDHNLWGVNRCRSVWDRGVGHRIYFACLTLGSDGLLSHLALQDSPGD